MSIDIAEQVVTDDNIELLVNEALGDIATDDLDDSGLGLPMLTQRIRLALYSVRNTYEIERQLLLQRDKAPDELYSYEGLAYFRPARRGVLLGGVHGTDIVDIVDMDGHYLVTFKVHRMATNADMRAARED